MTLDEYLAKTGTTEAAFGEKAKLSQPAINKLRRGISQPSLRTMRAIEVASDGAVKPNDWLEVAR